MYKFLALFVIIIFLTEISAFEIYSSNFSVGSFHAGLSGGNISSSEHESRFTFAYQGGGKAENANYSVNIGFFSQPEFCGDGICNADETCSTCPQDCGVCPPSPPAPSPGVTGGCTYDWVCSEWYPEPCPSEGIQKRVCVNRGTCTGTSGMPSTVRNCTPVIIPPSEPLFDLFVKIPLTKKWIIPGEDVEAGIELINVGNITKIDVLFKYWIVDEDNRLILEKQETRAIGEREKFSIWFPLPEDLSTGVYKLYAHITYDNKVALAGDSFEVFKNKFLIIGRIILFFVIFIFGVSLIIIIIKILKRKRKAKNEKLMEKIRKHRKFLRLRRIYKKKVKRQKKLEKKSVKLKKILRKKKRKRKRRLKRKFLIGKKKYEKKGEKKPKKEGKIEIIKPILGDKEKMKKKIIEERLRRKMIKEIRNRKKSKS